MALNPPELHQVWEYLKGMTVNIMILVLWLIIGPILTTDKRSVLTHVLHAVIANLFLMCFNQSSVCSHLLILGHMSIA